MHPGRQLAHRKGLGKHVATIDRLTGIGDVSRHEKNAQVRTHGQGAPSHFWPLDFRHDHVDQQEVDFVRASDEIECRMPAIGNANVIPETLKAGNGEGAHIRIIVDNENGGGNGARNRFDLMLVVSAVRLLSCTWKVDPDGRSFANTTLDVSVPPELAGDAVDLAKAQPSTRAGGFGGKKRFK